MDLFIMLLLRILLLRMLLIRMFLFCLSRTYLLVAALVPHSLIDAHVRRVFGLAATLNTTVDLQEFSPYRVRQMMILYQHLSVVVTVMDRLQIMIVSSYHKKAYAGKDYDNFICVLLYHADGQPLRRYHLGFEPPFKTVNRRLACFRSDRRRSSLLKSFASRAGTTIHSFIAP